MDNTHAELYARYKRFKPHYGDRITGELMSRYGKSRYSYASGSQTKCSAQGRPGIAVSSKCYYCDAGFVCALIQQQVNAPVMASNPAALIKRVGMGSVSAASHAIAVPMRQGSDPRGFVTPYRSSASDYAQYHVAINYAQVVFNNRCSRHGSCDLYNNRRFNDCRLVSAENVRCGSNVEWDIKTVDRVGYICANHRVCSGRKGEGRCDAPATRHSQVMAKEYMALDSSGRRQRGFAAISAMYCENHSFKTQLQSQSTWGQVVAMFNDKRVTDIVKVMDSVNKMVIGAVTVTAAGAAFGAL